MDEESRHESPSNVICSGQPILFNEHDTVSLYSGKTFTSWEECEQFLNEWAKSQGFHMIKDRVTREASIVRRRSFICDHSRTYNSSSIRDTSTKKLNCPFFVNASHPKNKNPQGFVFINKLNESHNHPLNRSMIEFEDAKRFTPEMIDELDL